MIQMKLIFSQPKGAFKRAQDLLDQAQNACAGDNWMLAIEAYDRAQSLLENDQRYVNLRGEILVYKAYCHLFLKQLQLADSTLKKGLTLITNEQLHQQLIDCYQFRRNATKAGKVARF